MTTVDVSIKAMFTKEMFDAISQSSSPAARYIARYARERYYLWDELAACAWLDSSHHHEGPRGLHGRGSQPRAELRAHAHMGREAQAGHRVRLVHAQVDVDLPKFSKMFVDLMSSSKPMPVKR